MCTEARRGLARPPGFVTVTDTVITLWGSTGLATPLRILIHSEWHSMDFLSLLLNYSFRWSLSVNGIHEKSSTHQSTASRAPAGGGASRPRRPRLSDRPTLPAPTRSSAAVPFSSLSLLHVAESLFYSYGPANLFHLKNRKSITLSFVVTESTYIQSFAIVLSPLIQLRIHTIKIEFFLNSPSFDIFLLFHPLPSPINSIIMCSCLQ